MKLADQILTLLMFDIQKQGSEIILPNFYVGAWEMDLFRLLDSGYLMEYEIKISRTDFFNDILKHRKDYKKIDGKYEKVKITKHSLLENRKYVANRFYYVVPKGLVTKEEIPSYCGLIYFNEEYKYFEVVKNAPLLHKNKPYEGRYKELCKKLAHRDYNRRYEKYIQFKNKVYK